MKYAATIFATEYAISPGAVARAAEERGFESLWFAEHSHIPASRESPWPGGAELPQMYYDAMDPMVAIAAAAEATSTIRLATGICLVPQRDPIQTAKTIASLDVLSGGRIIFGVGGGWNREEMANHGTDFSRRWKVMRERIEAMKAIWTEEEASYDGEFVSFDRIIANPKPVQKPHPPIHVGGVFPYGLRRAIRYGDGWMPIFGRGDDDIEGHVREFRKAAVEAGRDPDTMEVTLFGLGPDREVLARAADAGISRVIFFLLPMAEKDVVDYLDQLAEAAQLGR